MSRAVALLLLAAVAVGLAAQTDWRLGETALRDSLSRVPAKFRAEWLLKRGLDASRYTEYHRPESTGLGLVGRWSQGPSNEVTGRGNLVALTLGSEVALLSFASPDSPVVLSEIPLSFIPRQTVLHDSLLLTCGNGIEIWSIADSTHPVFRSVIPFGVGDFAVVDTFLYFASWGTFRAYSIANAANPYQLGSCQDSGYVTTATGHVAVVRELNDVLGFIDVSKPDVPRRVGTYPSYALSADARGSICCAAIYWSAGGDHFRFEVLDISDPANVTRIGSIDSVGGWDIHLNGRFAFVSGYQYVGWEFTVVDVQDSIHPRIVSSCLTPGNNNAIWADLTSDRAYIADGIGLAVIDITDINTPLLDTCMLAASSTNDMAVAGNLSYIANLGMKVLDVADPSRPREIGSIDTSGYTIQTVAVQDSFAYTEWNVSFNVASIDVSDPTSPTLAGGCDVYDPPGDMAIRDTFLYVAEDYWFHTINIARPRQPVIAGRCETVRGIRWGLALQDSFAYCGSWDGLSIVNIARPATPFLVSQTPGWRTLTHGVAVHDTLAFVASEYETLWVYSVADPAAPYPIAGTPLGSGNYGFDAAMYDDTLVFAGCAYNVILVNASDPAHPRVVGSYPTPNWVRHVLCSPPYLFACCENAGVCIFEIAQVAVEEPGSPSGQGSKPAATVVSGAEWSGVTDGAAVFDAMGRRVTQATAGVYFIREQSAVGSHHSVAASIRKVVIAR